MTNPTTCWQPVTRDRYCTRPFGHFGHCGSSTIAEHAAAATRDPWTGAIR